METQIINTLITLLVSGAAAWGGAKYALRYLEKTSENLERSINSLREDLKKTVSIDMCKDSKTVCRAEKTLLNGDITSKIDKLSKDVIEQNRRREDAKDDNTKLYFDIGNKLTRLEARLETLLDQK